MICYLDRTFCTTPGCAKDHALTPAVIEAAARADMPLSMARLCGEVDRRPWFDRWDAWFTGVFLGFALCAVGDGRPYWWVGFVLAAVVPAVARWRSR